MAPASTSNFTDYPGDLKFPGRMEVPRSTVTWTRELERRQTARQAEPGGSEEMWREEFQFSQESLMMATGVCSLGVLLSSVTTSP